MVGRWFFAVIGTIFAIMPAFVYWLAGWMASTGDPAAPTAGDIVAFTTLQSRLFFPMGQLLNVQVEIQGSLALFDRIFEYLDLEPEIRDAPGAVTLSPESVAGAVGIRGGGVRLSARACDRGGAADDAEEPRSTAACADDGAEADAEEVADEIAAAVPMPAAVAVQPRGHLVRGATRASWWPWWVRPAQARPRPPT